MNREAVAQELNKVSLELRQAEETLGILIGEERECHVQVWNELISQGATQWVAEKQGMIASAPKSIRIIKLTGRVKALKEQQDHFRFLIKYNLEGVIE